MMLKPDTPESRLLVDWVEGGDFLVTAQLLADFAVPCADKSSCLPANSIAVNRPLTLSLLLFHMLTTISSVQVYMMR